MQFAIARYAFQGGPEQLSLTPGEKLHVETVTDDGWVLGTRFQGTERLDGERGYFPLSYVEMQNDPESKSQASDSPDNGHAVHWTPMVTIDNFQGEPDAHGLSVVKNERVLALEQSEGGNAGWTFCKNSAGDKGYVPASFLCPITETHSSAKILLPTNSCAVPECAIRTETEGDVCSSCKVLEDFNSRILRRAPRANHAMDNTTRQTMVHLLVNKLLAS